MTNAAVVSSKVADHDQPSSSVLLHLTTAVDRRLWSTAFDEMTESLVVCRPCLSTEKRFSSWMGIRPYSFLSSSWSWSRILSWFVTDLPGREDDIVLDRWSTNYNYNDDSFNSNIATAVFEYFSYRRMRTCS